MIYLCRVNVELTPESTWRMAARGQSGLFHRPVAAPRPAGRGSAEGLRKRGGLQAWPMLRQGKAELVAQIRRALGAERFEQAFAAGARLTQREAVAAVRGQRGGGTGV
jgi:hypothetical protein